MTRFGYYEINERQLMVTGRRAAGSREVYNVDHNPPTISIASVRRVVHTAGECIHIPITRCRNSLID